MLVLQEWINNIYTNLTDTLADSSHNINSGITKKVYDKELITANSINTLIESIKSLSNNVYMSNYADCFINNEKLDNVAYGNLIQSTTKTQIDNYVEDILNICQNQVSTITPASGNTNYVNSFSASGNTNYVNNFSASGFTDYVNNFRASGFTNYINNFSAGFSKRAYGGFVNNRNFFRSGFSNNTFFLSSAHSNMSQTSSGFSRDGNTFRTSGFSRNGNNFRTSGCTDYGNNFQRGQTRVDFQVKINGTLVTNSNII